MGEQGAEPGWLRFAHEPRGEQVARGVVIDGGGLKGCPDRLAANTNQLLERIPLGAGGRSDVPFAGELRVAQAGRSCKKRDDLGRCSRTRRFAAPAAAVGLRIALTLSAFSRSPAFRSSRSAWLRAPVNSSGGSAYN